MNQEQEDREMTYISRLHDMRDHTPKDKWLLLGMLRWSTSSSVVIDSHGVSGRHKDKLRNSINGCVIDFHTPDARWDDDEASEAYGNQNLIQSAPWLLEQVNALRAEYHALTGRHWYGTPNNNEVST